VQVSVDRLGDKTVIAGVSLEDIRVVLARSRRILFVGYKLQGSIRIPRCRPAL